MKEKEIEERFERLQDREQEARNNRDRHELHSSDWKYYNREMLIAHRAMIRLARKYPWVVKI